MAEEALADGKLTREFSRYDDALIFDIEMAQSLDIVSRMVSIYKEQAPLSLGLSTIEASRLLARAASRSLWKCSGCDHGEGAHVGGIPQAAVDMADSCLTASK